MDSRWRRLPEIISLIDRPTEDGTFVSLCFTRLPAAVFEFFKGFVGFEISTGSSFGH
jgi:hypothetical protein